MSFIPDCRNDECYNEDFLTDKDKAEVCGYDWCAEMVVDNFFNNLDVYFEDDDDVMLFLNKEHPEDERYEEEVEFRFIEGLSEKREIKTFADLIRSKLLEWIESDRNEMITSMIEGMDEDVYKAIRAKVLEENDKSDNPKEYYNTQKYVVTGKKERTIGDDT